MAIEQEQKRISADEARKILKSFRFWEKFASQDFIRSLRLGVLGWWAMILFSYIVFEAYRGFQVNFLAINLWLLFGIVFVILLSVFIGRRKFERLQQYYERVIYSVAVKGEDHFYLLALKCKGEDEVLYVFRTTLMTANDGLKHLEFSHVFDLEHEVNIAVFRYGGTIRFVFSVKDYVELAKQLIYEGNTGSSFDDEVRFLIRNKIQRVFPRVQFESFSGMKAYFEQRFEFFSHVFNNTHQQISGIELNLSKLPISRLIFKLVV